jgi:hypothetical protein
MIDMKAISGAEQWLTLSCLYSDHEFNKKFKNFSLKQLFNQSFVALYINRKKVPKN